MKAIIALHGDKAILIIIHRFFTVELCDRLYQLEQGKIVEEGALESMSLAKEVAKLT